MRTEALEFAIKSIGQEEIRGNQGFKDPVFDMILRRAGFKDGWAWCSLFAEACYMYPTYSGKSKVLAAIGDCFSPNAVKTYRNFQKEGGLYFDTGKTPRPGSVVIWEKRRGGAPVKKGIWTLGHAGIVEKVETNHFISIEGNTNDDGGREGIKVARKKRPYNFGGDNGLCLLGFITPNF